MADDRSVLSNDQMLHPSSLMSNNRSPLPTSPSGAAGIDSGRRVELHRWISARDATILLITATFGGSIFEVPGSVLRASGSPCAAIVSWIIGAIIVIPAALCFAELGASIPSSGAEMAYFSATLPEPVAFSFVVCCSVVMSPATLALCAILAGRYLVDLLKDVVHFNEVYIGAILLLLLLFIHFFGGHWLQRFHRIGFALQLGALILVSASGVISLSSGSGWQPTSFSQCFAHTDYRGMGLGVMATLYAYDGWALSNSLTEEMHDVSSLPRSILVSIICVMLSYVLVNFAFLAGLGPFEMKNTKGLAIELTRAMIGDWAAGVIGISIAFGSLCTADASIAAASRVIFTASRFNILPIPWLAELGSRGRMPVRSALVLVSIALVLLAFNSFDVLIQYVGSVAWIFYGLVALSLIILRVKQPLLHRPFKVALFPLSPLVLILLALSVLAYSAYGKPIPTLVGVAIVGVSMAVGAFKIACSKRHRMRKHEDSISDVDQHNVESDSTGFERLLDYASESDHP